MKTINTVALILSSLLVVSGCKTLDGAGRAFGNLTGSKLHEKFEGTYISQNSLQPLKERQDKLSGSGDLISYSGLNIPEDHVRKVHIVDAPALTAYLQDILNRLIQHWDGVPVKVKVQIVSTQNFAPYADAYGTISVPLGMLENVESEDEIASLLAHEVSHILLRHHERSEVMNTQKDQVTLLAKSVMLANVAKDTKIAKIGGKYDVKYNASKQGQENITNAALYNYLINGFSDSVWNTAWQRAQEDEADLLAIDLATSAGYAPRASSYNLQRLSDFQGKQKSILSAFWEEKTTALKTSIQQLDLNSLTTQADSIINEGVGTMLTAASDFFQRSHMSPERRDLNLREYVRREYGGESRKRVSKTSWDSIRNTAESQDVFNGYRNAFAASAAIASKNLVEAEKLARQSLNKTVENHPGIREVMYDLRMAQNQQQNARRNFELVGNWAHASPDFFEKKVDFEMQQKNFQNALDYIELAESTFGNRSLFIVKKSIALANLQQINQAIATLKECRTYPSTKETCETLLAQIDKT